MFSLVAWAMTFPILYARPLGHDRAESFSSLLPQLVFGLYRGRVVIATSTHLDVVYSCVIDETPPCANISCNRRGVPVNGGEPQSHLFEVMATMFSPRVHFRRF